MTSNHFFSFRSEVKYFTIFLVTTFIIALTSSFAYSRINHVEIKDDKEEAFFEEIVSDITFDNELYIVRFSDSSLTLPNNWVPIMDSTDKAFYIAKSEKESLDLIDCANKSDCKDYFLKITLGDMMTVTREDPISYLKNGTNYYDSFKLYTEGEYEIFYGIPPKCFTSSEGFLPYFCDEEYDGGSQFVVFSKDGKNYVSVYLSSTTDSIDIDFLTSNFNLDELFLERIKYYELPENRSVYKVKIESSLITSDFGKLGHVISNYLPTQNSRDYNSMFVEYEGDVYQNNYPRDNFLNFSYILSTTNTTLEKGLYGTNQIKILVEDIDEDISFGKTKGVDACITDSDCVFRQYSCSFNAYNKYLYVSAESESNCARYNLADLGSSSELESELSCKPKVIYDDVKCVESKCKLINPKISCSE